jgi:hypothetical protein
MTCRRISGAVWCGGWTQPGRTRPDHSGPLTGRTNRIHGPLRPAEGLRRNRLKITNSSFSMGVSPMKAGTSIHSTLNLLRLFSILSGAPRSEPPALPRFRSVKGRAVPPGLSRGPLRRESGEPPSKLRQLSYHNRQPRGQSIVAIALSHSAQWWGLRYNPCNRSVVARRAGIGGHRPAAGIRSSEIGSMARGR